MHTSRTQGEHYVRLARPVEGMRLGEQQLPLTLRQFEFSARSGGHGIRRPV